MGLYAGFLQQVNYFISQDASVASVAYCFNAFNVPTLFTAMINEFSFLLTNLSLCTSGGKSQLSRSNFLFAFCSAPHLFEIHQKAGTEKEINELTHVTVVAKKTTALQY